MYYGISVCIYSGSSRGPSSGGMSGGTILKNRCSCSPSFSASVYCSVLLKKLYSGISNLRNLAARSGCMLPGMGEWGYPYLSNCYYTIIKILCICICICIYIYIFYIIVSTCMMKRINTYGPPMRAPLLLHYLFVKLCFTLCVC